MIKRSPSAPPRHGCHAQGCDAAILKPDVGVGVPQVLAEVGRCLEQCREWRMENAPPKCMWHALLGVQIVRMVRVGTPLVAILLTEGVGLFDFFMFAGPSIDDILGIVVATQAAPH